MPKSSQKVSEVVFVTPSLQQLVTSLQRRKKSKQNLVWCHFWLNPNKGRKKLSFVNPEFFVTPAQSKVHLTLSLTTKAMLSILQSESPKSPKDRESWKAKNFQQTHCLTYNGLSRHSKRERSWVWRDVSSVLKLHKIFAKLQSVYKPAKPFRPTVGPFASGEFVL